MTTDTPTPPAARAHGRKAARLRDLLADAPAPLSSAELSQASGISPSSIGELLRYDIRKGRVLATLDPARPDRRRYALASE